MKEYTSEPHPGYIHKKIPTFDDMTEIMRQISHELYYASSGNKAAGRRARKKLQELKQKAQECREQILDQIIGKSPPKPKADQPKAEPLGRNLDLSDE